MKETTKQIFLIAFFFTIILFVNADTITSFRINNGAEYTNDTNLLLSISVNEDAYQMRFSCNNSDWSNFETFSETKYFDINTINYGCNPNEGLKTIYVDVNFVDGSRHSIDNNIILDKTPPTAENFSPIESVNGDGAEGQLISTDFFDNNGIDNVAISLIRDGTTVYDFDTNICLINSETNVNCSFIDYGVDRGGNYSYEFIITDLAGNDNYYENNFSFTDSIAPQKPEIPTGTAIGTTINFSWEANTENDLNNYAVYRSTQDSFDCNTETFLAFVQTNNISNTGLDENTTYYYKISALDLTGNQSTCSDQNYFTTLYDSNIVPVITRTDISCDSNYWCYDKNPTFSFEVENAEYSWIITTSATTNPSNCTFGVDCNTSSTVSFNNISNGTSYFKVKAVKPNGSSSVSTHILKIDSTSPPQPNPTIELFGKNVLLTWQKVTDSGGSGIYRYYIHRSQNASFSSTTSTKLDYVNDENTSFKDITPIEGQTYYYKVLAQDVAGNYSSDYNAPILSITIPTDLEEVVANIIIKNSFGIETKYFNKADDFNITIIFSKEVDDFYFYKKIDDENTETIIQEKNDINSYTHSFITSANYKKIVFNINAKHPINDINEEIILNFDNTRPTIDFQNIIDEETIIGTKKINIKAEDNFEVAKVELFLNGIKIGNAIKEDSQWVYDFNSIGKISGELKAIATDGVDLTEEKKINIKLVQTEEPTEELTIEKVVEKINEAIQKQIELEQKISTEQIILNEELQKLKEEADNLIIESENLLEINLEVALQKTIQAIEKYALIIEKIEENKTETMFFNTAFLVLGIVAIIVAIILSLSLIMKTKKFKKMFNKHNMIIDEDTKTKK
ncbi:MAG: hypothetical protein PHP82_01640 [Candidatus ainarchaeum sp.]|nr:hypothetical protein [Candidatus ainarchaeum sp.]